MWCVVAWCVLFFVVCCAVYSSASSRRRRIAVVVILVVILAVAPHRFASNANIHIITITTRRLYFSIGFAGVPFHFLGFPCFSAAPRRPPCGNVRGGCCFIGFAWFSFGYPWFSLAFSPPPPPARTQGSPPGVIPGGGAGSLRTYWAPSPGGPATHNLTSYM